jgi:hypothetical protein
VVPITAKSKIDFSTTVLPDRSVTKNEQVTFDEVADLKVATEKTKPVKSKVLAGFN